MNATRDLRRIGWRSEEARRFKGHRVTQSFVEYRSIRAVDPLRQGDILEAVDAETSMWSRHLVVITADCDFAHKKHQGRVTCVPLLTSDEYLLHMVIPRIRARLVRKPLADLSQLMTQHNCPTITDRRLTEWIEEEADDAILATLGLPEAAQTPATNALTAIRLTVTPNAGLAEAIKALIEGQAFSARPPKRENAIQNVIGPLRDTFSQPPGDAFFLSALTREHVDGYFAYLRHLEQIWEQDIAVGPTHHQVTYRRIGALQDRYTHALVQRFASVFMAIGLPDEYETVRALHAEMLEEYVT